MSDNQNTDPRRTDARGHGLLLIAAAWFGVCMDQLSTRFPDLQVIFWLLLLTVVLGLSHVARRL